MNISSTVNSTITDNNGNSVPLLGYNVSIELNQELFKRGMVLEKAQQNNIPLDRFKEIRKSNSFKNALNRQKKLTKSQGKIINFVEEDKGSITFQLDIKNITETNKQTNDSDGNSSTETVKLANYINDTTIVFDKITGRIICDNQEVLAMVYQKLQVFQESYLKRNISKYINDILEEQAGMIAWRSAGGVYFVPIKYQQLLMNVVNFVKSIDNQAVVKIAEVPDMKFATASVKESAEETLNKDLQNLSSELRELEKDGDLLTDSMKRKRLEKLARLNRKIEEYQILVKSDLKKVERESKKVNFMIENFAKYGTVKSPISEVEMSQEQIEELPEDIQLMLEI